MLFHVCLFNVDKAPPDVSVGLWLYNLGSVDDATTRLVGPRLAAIHVVVGVEPILAAVALTHLHPMPVAGNSITDSVQDILSSDVVP